MATASINEAFINAEVLKRVKAHPMFRDEPDEKQRQLATELSDRKSIKEKFEHLLDIEEQWNATLEESEVEYLHSLEIEQAKRRQKHEVARACHLPVKLVLSKLSRGVPPLAGPLTSLLRFEYGPLHAGLVVGNVIIEWDDSSLIIPQLAPVIPGDFQAHCQGGAWEQRTGELVKDMSLANRRNSDTPVKLDVLLRSLDEKEQLIEKLVDEIIRFNTAKKYNIFSCNCQHFVSAAMDSLGIKESPKFKGHLNDYLQRLKHGKERLLEFDSHEELDRHVSSSLENLDKRDKEYYLCLYFQFHLPQMKDLNPEEQENWKCPLASCLCARLETLVADEALVFHQFQRGIQPANRSAPRQPLPCLQEEPEEDFKYSKFMDRSESEEEHSLQLAACYGYSERVISKLQSLADYRKLSEDELKKLSEILSEKEEFRREYLKKHIDGISREIVDEASMDSDLKDDVLTPRDSRRRSNERFEKLLNPTVQLIHRFHEETENGNIHIQTALQVGEYVYEWNDTNLLIPREIECLFNQPLLVVPILHLSNWKSTVSRESKQMKQASEKHDHAKQIMFHYEFTEKKDKLLLDFAMKVLEFNRDKYYDPVTCNNQTFLTEAMRSLQIKDRAIPSLTPTIEEYLQQIKLSRSLRKRQLGNHQELDEFVVSSDHDLPKDDIEYLMVKYFQFHICEWKKLKRSQEKWFCPIPTCKLPCLQGALMKQLSVISL